MENKRIYLYDNLKFLLILFVIIGHFIDYGGKAFSDYVHYDTFIFIYAFHMPLFVFISGLFFKATNITKKVFFYLSAAVMMKAVTFLFQRLITQTGELDFVDAIGPPWFLVALAAFTLISYFLSNINQYLVLIIAVIFTCFAGYTDSVNTFLSLSRIIVFFPFYYMGVIFDANKVAETLNKRIFKAIGAGLLILWGVLVTVLPDKMYTLRRLFTGANPYSRLPSGMVNEGGLYRLLCYVISGLLCFALLSLIPRKRLPLISCAGGKTLQIYFWHLPVIIFIHQIDTLSSLADVPLGAIVSVFICVGIAFLLAAKPFSFPTELLKKYTFEKKK